MWSNGYNVYGNMPQLDAQSNNWFSQYTSNGMSNPFGMRFDNYPTAAAAATTNPFAGQTFGAAYQPNNAFGYQYRGW